MEINNSNGSGSHESARFQIFHLLTPPKSCRYRSLVPDSRTAPPPSPLFGTDSSEQFFFYSSNISFSRLQAAIVYRSKQFPGRESAGLPYLAIAVCAGAAHATAYMYKINVGTLQAKLGTGEVMQPSLRSRFTSTKSPVSPSLRSRELGSDSRRCLRMHGFSLAAHALSGDGFALPEQPALPVKSYHTDSFRYQRKAVAITAVLITLVTLHLGKRRRLPAGGSNAGSGRARRKPPGGIFGLCTHFRFTCI